MIPEQKLLNNPPSDLLSLMGLLQVFPTCPDHLMPRYYQLFTIGAISTTYLVWVQCPPTGVDLVQYWFWLPIVIPYMEDMLTGSISSLGRIEESQNKLVELIISLNNEPIVKWLPNIKLRIQSNSRRIPSEVCQLICKAAVRSHSHHPWWQEKYWWKPMFCTYAMLIHTDK